MQILLWIGIGALAIIAAITVCYLVVMAAYCLAALGAISLFEKILMRERPRRRMENTVKLRNGIAYPPNPDVRR